MRQPSNSPAGCERASSPSAGSRHEAREIDQRGPLTDGGRSHPGHYGTMASCRPDAAAYRRPPFWSRLMIHFISAGPRRDHWRGKQDPGIGTHDPERPIVHNRGMRREIKTHPSGSGQMRPFHPSIRADLSARVMLATAREGDKAENRAGTPWISGVWKQHRAQTRSKPHRHDLFCGTGVLMTLLWVPDNWAIGGGSGRSSIRSARQRFPMESCPYRWLADRIPSAHLRYMTAVTRSSGTWMMRMERFRKRP